MQRMDERMGAEIAMHRTKFDQAVQDLLDQASRLTSDEAVALTTAAAEKAAFVHTQGPEGATPSASGPRRRSFVMARDAQLLKTLGSMGTPGGGAAAGAGEGGGGEAGGDEGPVVVVVVDPVEPRLLHVHHNRLVGRHVLQRHLHGQRLRQQQDSG